MQTVGAVLMHAAVVTNARASYWPAELTAPGRTTNEVEESTEMKKNNNVAYTLRPLSLPGNAPAS